MGSPASYGWSALICLCSSHPSHRATLPKQAYQRVPPDARLSRTDTLVKYPNPSCSVPPTPERDTKTYQLMHSPSGNGGKTKLVCNKRMEIESTKAIARPWFLEPYTATNLLQ